MHHRYSLGWTLHKPGVEVGVLEARLDVEVSTHWPDDFETVGQRVTRVDQHIAARFHHSVVLRPRVARHGRAADLWCGISRLVPVVIRPRTFGHTPSRQWRSSAKSAAPSHIAVIRQTIKHS